MTLILIGSRYNTELDEGYRAGFGRNTLASPYIDAERRYKQNFAKS